MRTITVIALFALLAGCSAPVTLSEDLIKQKPVVKMGGAAPAESDYILYIPAGQTFPADLTIDGSLLRQSGDATTQISMKRDLYLYQDWASHDGKKWQRLNKVIGIKVGIGANAEGSQIKVGLESAKEN
jgi:hypothetical protein